MVALRNSYISFISRAYFFTVWTTIMINTLKHYYSRSIARKLFFGLTFLLGIFVTTLTFINADAIPFEDDLPSIFPWWFNSGYYSNTRFKYGWNNFIGIIFRQTWANLFAPETISINGWAQQISCATQLRWVYYNNQRWRRLWPLDTGNLIALSGSTLTTWYSTMTMSGWFYTDCTSISWYTPELYEVYGQITHNLNGLTYNMYAGMEYDFIGNNISWSSFADTFTIISWGIHWWHMFDTNGWIADIHMNAPRCQSFTMTPTPAIIQQWENINFSCSAINVSWYILSFFLSWNSSPYSSDMSNYNSTIGMRSTWNSLPVGQYLVACLPRTPSTLLPQCGEQLLLTVQWTGTTTPSSWTWCNPNFQWEIAFASLSWSRVFQSPWYWWTYYTNTTGIKLQWSATEPNTINISWDFSPAIISWSYTGHNIFNDIGMIPITLSGINVWNTLNSTYTTTSWGMCIYTDAMKRVYVDTLPPTTPIITSPHNGAGICPANGITLIRSASNDGLGSQISHYSYEIYTNSGMTTSWFLLSGNVPAGTTTISIPQFAYFPLGTYYVKVSAVDNVWLSSSSLLSSFTTSQQYCSSGTGIIIVTPTIWLRNTDLDTVYRSDPIWIQWLTWPTLVSISKGMLFIDYGLHTWSNNQTGVGTTGLVTSNDTIYIELVSSNQYDTTVTSDLYVAWLTWTFSMTTKKSSCTLSATEKLLIQNIYENIKDEYNNNIGQLAEFLNTFQSMVDDEVNLSNSCTLEYLLTLIDDEFDIDGIDTSNHITPNCKEYSIGYDNNQHAYYAPQMIQKFFFINRESLIRHLDYYNPGDCHINTYGNDLWTSDNSDPMVHIAPNGKIYHFVGQYGWYSATEFISAKYFDSLQNIKTYIDLRNPAKSIWKHDIDTSFMPIVYAAPNTKEYKLYKTNKWFMSYKLMKVRYFTSLSEIKSYIDKNNPSKR